MLKRTQSLSELDALSNGADSLLSARKFLSKGPVQFLCQQLAALAPAAVLWIVISGGSPAAANFHNTLFALGAAAALVWFIMAKLRNYAKSRLLSYVFPVNFLVFTSILAVIALLRVDYSAYQYAVGAMGSVLASYILAMLLRRAIKLQYVIAGGRTDQIKLGGQYVSAPAHEELLSLVEARRLNGSIVADLHHDHSPEWARLFAKASLQGIAVYHYRQVAEAQSGQVKISHLSENELGSLIPNAPYMTTKRLADIAVSLALLPFCLFAFALIGILIKLDSRGSIFFIQERMGFRGKTFQMIKFRTMRARSISDDQDAQRLDAMTKADDERITAIGRFLRKTRIDELPQILNVLRGEMSWIGPRPEAGSLSTWYERELPFYSYRHIVRPGITGWAQVNQGHVTDIDDVNAKLRFDFYYVKNLSMWLDVLIVFKTIRVVLTGNGAR